MFLIHPKFQRLAAAGASLLLVLGCVHAQQRSLPAPEMLAAPEPLQDNSGEFLCPYTSDGVAAKWVDKGINAKLGSQVGGTVGSLAASTAASAALRSVPGAGLFAGFAGNAIGSAVGRKIALEGAGGSEFMKQTSDLSFRSLSDMSIWMYANYSKTENYQKVFDMVAEIYPDLKSGYMGWVMNAQVLTAPRAAAAPKAVAAAVADPGGVAPRLVMDDATAAHLALVRMLKGGGTVTSTPPPLRLRTVGGQPLPPPATVLTMANRSGSVAKLSLVTGDQAAVGGDLRLATPTVSAAAGSTALQPQLAGGVSPPADVVAAASATPMTRASRFVRLNASPDCIITTPIPKFGLMAQALTSVPADFKSVDVFSPCSGEIEYFVGQTLAPVSKQQIVAGKRFRLTFEPQELGATSKESRR